MSVFEIGAAVAFKDDITMRELKDIGIEGVPVRQFEVAKIIQDDGKGWGEESVYSKGWDVHTTSCYIIPASLLVLSNS